MTPAEYVAEKSARIAHLEQWRSETTEAEHVEVLDAEIREERRLLADFIEFANGIYWSTDEAA